MRCLLTNHFIIVAHGDWICETVGDGNLQVVHPVLLDAEFLSARTARKKLAISCLIGKTDFQKELKSMLGKPSHPGLSISST